MAPWLLLVLLGAPPQFGLNPGAPPPRPRPAPRPVATADAGVCLPREPDRSCTTDADCALVRRTVDCCGTFVVTGVNQRDLSSYQAWLKACGPRRACGCMAAPTRLDDRSELEPGARVRATCQANVCTSTQEPLERCEPRQCGPAPKYPTALCPDGINHSGRGPCARVEGVCRWARLECP